MVKRPRRFNLPKPLRIGNLLVIVILFFIGWGIFDWLRSFIVVSPYFRISKIEIVLIGRVPLTDKTIRDLLNIERGRNIFDINLKATKDYVLSNYPEVRTLVINRVFPNKLALKIRPRRPVAQLSLSSGFCLIDGEGVILPNIKTLAQEGLPIITGVDSRSVLANVGRKYDYLGLRRALWLLEVINQMNFSQEHEIHMIDASDEKNLSLYIEGGIEIKIGGEDFPNKITMLNKTFSSGRLDKAQIRYIDLRFGNVIIGPR